MKLVATAVLFIAGCTTPEQAWTYQQREKCAAMGGTGHYDAATKEFSCWRHPVARHTRLLFKTSFLSK